MGGDKIELSKENKIPELQFRGTIRDFILPIVEFLGILVPGFVFILSFLLSMIVPLASLLQIIGDAEPKSPSLIIENILNMIVSPKSGTLIMLSIVSYVVGHLFFRQDPKIPDKHSFMKILRNDKQEGPVRLCDRERAYNREKKIDNPDDFNLEFPYRYLKEYLHDRGMYHLADMIPWEGNNPDTYKKRTKHFINILKVRLEFLFPYQYIRIQRNEAHIRLMSSMWYASTSLIYVSLIGCLIGAVAIIVSMLVSHSLWPITYICSIAVPMFVLILATLSRRHIESFLHYQRIREIVFILEAAYFAKKLYPAFDFAEQGLEKNA